MRHQATIRQVIWQDIRESVNKINPSFCQHIDALSPDHNYPLFVASYPFGTKILHQGQLYLPTPKGTVEPISSIHTANSIKSQLQFRFVPLSLVLEKTIEVYFSGEDRLISLNFLGPNSFFGLWEILDPPTSHFIKDFWSILSGARSLSMLPKITDAKSHKEIRKIYNIKSHIPRSYLDHWNTFSQMANSQQFHHEWHSKILFFSDNWITKAKEDTAWLKFKKYLLQYAWKQSQYWRNKVTFDFIWELFSHEILKQNIKPNLYFIDIVKHLVLIGAGVSPGYIPADGTDKTGPISTIQQAYIEHYKLKDYIPTIMEPHHFSLTDDTPIYYSLQQPSLLQTTPKSSHIPSVLKSIHEIDFLMETFRLEILQGEFSGLDQNSPINLFANKVSCDYFHSDVKDNKQKPISPVKKMINEDQRLLTMSKNQSKKRIFAHTSQFLKGCVRLAKKK